MFGIGAQEQLFNVNRFSIHYRKVLMDLDQVEAFYLQKITAAVGTWLTPHRFRHTLATDLMRQPERNVKVTQDLLNHTNISTTLGYVETDHEVIRVAMAEREARSRVRRMVARVDAGSVRAALNQTRNALIDMPLTERVFNAPEELPVTPNEARQDKPCVAPTQDRSEASGIGQQLWHPADIPLSTGDVPLESTALQIPGMRELLTELLTRLSQTMASIQLPPLTAGLMGHTHQQAISTLQTATRASGFRPGQGLRSD
ncbi:site-specific integrase [Azorhizophilus paspali]|uniref:Site-specific integrase n=1 Tax=Azorhizophilus paspali TaxID=69963 RepID=A0ABV6SFC6_AZOPA